MARKKVKLEYIENDTARRVTYKKRVKGIVKKTQELSVLCGVDACAIMYGQYERAPVVWPSSEVEARRILAEYKRKPEIDQSQRRLTQQSFLKQSVSKAEERLLKLQRRNREMEMEHLMAQLLNGKPLEQVAYADMGDLLWVIDDKLRTIQHKIGMLDGSNIANANANANANDNENENENAPENPNNGDGENLNVNVNVNANVTVNPTGDEAGPSGTGHAMNQAEW